MRKLLLASIAGCIIAGSAQAELINVPFSGQFGATTGELLTAGDSFRGTFSIESNTPTWTYYGLGLESPVYTWAAFYKINVGGTEYSNQTGLLQYNVVSMKLTYSDAVGSVVQNGFAMNFSSDASAAPSGYPDIQGLNQAGRNATFQFQAFVFDGVDGDFNPLTRNGTAEGTGKIGGPLITAVPEPATWAMMIVGFGLVGSTMRRRKAAVATRVHFA